MNNEILIKIHSEEKNKDILLNISLNESKVSIINKLQLSLPEISSERLTIIYETINSELQKIKNLESKAKSDNKLSSLNNLYTIFDRRTSSLKQVIPEYKKGNTLKINNSKANYSKGPKLLTQEKIEEKHDLKDIDLIITFKENISSFIKKKNKEKENLNIHENYTRLITDPNESFYHIKKNDTENLLDSKSLYTNSKSQKSIFSKNTHSTNYEFIKEATEKAIQIDQTKFFKGKTKKKGNYLQILTVESFSIYSLIRSPRRMPIMRNYVKQDTGKKSNENKKAAAGSYLQKYAKSINKESDDSSKLDYSIKLSNHNADSSTLVNKKSSNNVNNKGSNLNTNKLISKNDLKKIVVRSEIKMNTTSQNRNIHNKLLNMKTTSKFTSSLENFNISCYSSIDEDKEEETNRDKIQTKKTLNNIIANIDPIEIKTVEEKNPKQIKKQIISSIINKMLNIKQ